ncbi:MAG: CBS domain-containing protein [Bacteroidetes bacterium]|nr:CBS domain-containing protein [Bacteroidales bacterium]MBU1010269.1 CBS domain-containing protein [Bacteroidota bacterium]
MIAKHMITDGILPLKTSDTGRMALSWMEDFRVMHMPIVNNEGFLGLIAEIDIYNFNNFDEAVGNHTLSLSKSFVYEYQHIFEAMKVMQENHLSLVPVINDHGNYLGSITLQSLLEHFALSLSVSDPGGILVLEMSSTDYSLAEIARIIESNDAKLLSVFINSEPDSTRIEVSLKINRIDLSGIMQTFYRFNYNIKASFSERNDLDDLRERFDSLMNYLNI